MLYETAVTDENKTVKSEVEVLHQMNSNGYFLKNNLCDRGIGLVAKQLGGLKNMCLFECQMDLGVDQDQQYIIYRFSQS